MENASKALLMAGGVLLTILVITLLLYAWASFSEYQNSLDEAERVQELAKFNSQFTNFVRDDIQGYELLSLINKVIDYNQRFSTEFINTSAVGNSGSYSPITLKIESVNIEGISITIPATVNIDIDIDIEKEVIGPKNALFVDTTYTLSDTQNPFNDVLEKVKKIEDKFGGATGAQNLVKSRGTIFESIIKDINEGQPDYEENYIISRYNTLTGNNAGSIKDIREKTVIEDVCTYYEYMEFKKLKFECKELTYNEQTGRVSTMKYKIKE